MGLSKDDSIKASWDTLLLEAVENDELFGCGAGRGRFCVDPWGDLYGCSKLATILGPKKGALPLGNVFQGFTEISNRQQLLVTAVGPRRKCARCAVRRECSGSCPAVNVFYNNDVFTPDELSCKLTFVGGRVDDYMRRRHDQVFGTNWHNEPTETGCELDRVTPLPAS